MSDLRVRKKNWRERKSVFSVLLIVMFVILLAAMIVIWKLKSFTREKLCTTKECVESAYFFLELLDPASDPCHNFYNFTCGNYKGDLVVRNIQKRVNKEVKGLMVGPTEEGDSRSIKWQKAYYQSCMNLTAIEEDENKSLKQLLNKVNTWPVLVGDKWAENDFDWGELVQKCKEVGLYYDWFISIDELDDEQKLKATPPNNVNDIETNLKQKYVELMTNVVKKLGAPGYFAKIFNEMKEVMLFETELYEIIHEASDNDTQCSLEELENKYPHIPWSSIFKDVILPKHDKITFRADSYVQKLKTLLGQTSRQTKANYVFWKLIESFSLFLSHNIRREFEMFAALSRNYSYPKDREDYCLAITSTVFAYVSEAEFVRKYAPLREPVHDMVTRIKSALNYRLAKANWMSDSDKSLAIFKLKHMKVIVGGPDEMYDEEEFDKFLGLDKINVSGFDTVVDLICGVDKIRDKYNLDFVKPKITLQQAKFYQSSVILGHTKYLPDENTMFLPAAALDSLFYSKRTPQYLNYGALGTVIAHELAHGFGIEGNTIYGYEETKILWTNYTHENFFNAAQCLLRNCNDIGIENNVGMNCEATFEENFADHVGINLAYEAYTTLQQEIGAEKHLPGLMYGPTQLFWVAYSSVMCNNIELNDTEPFTHLLPYQRILGAFRNTDYFAKDFNCPVGSSMNPAEKCKIL